MHNCIDGEMASLLRSALRRFASEEEARVVVVTGAGPSFCSGADLGEIEELVRRTVGGGPPALGFSDLDVGKPAIAAIEGYCLGGGVELAVWCDFAVAAADARFGAANRRSGVPWVDGGTQRLARRVGTGNALYLIETGEMVEAPRALAMGLVQEVTERGRALARALALATRMASYPQGSLLSDRSSALAALGVPLEDGFRLEAEAGLPSALDGEMAAGIRRFLERRDV